MNLILSITIQFSVMVRLEVNLGSRKVVVVKEPPIGKALFDPISGGSLAVNRHTRLGAKDSNPYQLIQSWV